MIAYHPSLSTRIEDDLLVTEAGCEVLTASCPKTVQELEQLISWPALPPAPLLLRRPVADYFIASKVPGWIQRMMKNVTDGLYVSSFQRQNVPAWDLLSFLPEKPSSVKVTMYRCRFRPCQVSRFLPTFGGTPAQVIFQSHNGICLEIGKTGKSKFQLAMTFGLWDVGSDCFWTRANMQI
jgi:hypothetical protein